MKVAMDEKSVQKLLFKSLSNVKCEFCGQYYQAANMTVLGHREDLWFLSIYCSGCRRRRLAVVVIERGQVSEVVTEPTEAENDKLSTSIDSELDSDDLLDMHIFLKDFSGDFSSLFSEK